MSYSVAFSDSFRRSIKQLKKRYRHVQDDVRVAIRVLLANSKLGAAIPGGNGIRKLRLRNSDLQTGKSGGYRLLYFVEDETSTLYMLLLYAKSDRENVLVNELQELINEVFGER